MEVLSFRFILTESNPVQPQMDTDERGCQSSEAGGPTSDFRIPTSDFRLPAHRWFKTLALPRKLASANGFRRPAGRPVRFFHFFRNPNPLSGKHRVESEIL